MRVGLDAGTAAGGADVASDGEATPAWAAECADAAGGDRAACAPTRPAGSANVTLFFRALRGSTVVQLSALQADRPGLRVGVGPAEHTLLLSGTTAPEQLEPAASRLTLQHACEAGASGTYGVRATLLVREHAPISLGWRWAC